MRAEPAPTSRRAPTPRLDGLLVAEIALLARLPMALADRGLLFDDGVYGISVIDMRRGLAPYAGVFASQGPLHYPLLRLGDLIGFQTADAPRLTPVVAGVLTSVAVWAVARRLRSGRGPALIAGLLCATSGSMIRSTANITGDAPALALATAAVWAALAHRDRPRTRTALLTGVLIGGALAVKPLAGTALVPVIWWLHGGRPTRTALRDLAAAGGAAIATWFAAALPFGLGPVWDQSIAYHLGGGPEPSKASHLVKLVTVVPERDGFVVLAAVLALIATLTGRAGTTARRADAMMIAVWVGTTAAILVLQQALYANHFVNLVVALCCAYAVRPPPARWLAIAVIAAVPWWLVHNHTFLRPPGWTTTEQALLDDLRALPAGSRAIADEPGYLWRAGLSTPPLMNDPARARIDQASLTTESLVAAARTPRACAVVIWTERFGELLPNLRPALTRAGYERTADYGRGRELWVRDVCRVDRTPAAAGSSRSPG
ncbi:MAG: glycosyltransferase family 39 protein [Actinomycetota bacterium]